MGTAVFLAIYLPVFWDHIPTLLAHKYYCEKLAGFWIYTNLEEWQSRNPDINDSPRKQSSRKSKPENGVAQFQLTSRLYAEMQRSPHFAHAIGRTEETVVDVMTGEVLARAIDFWRGPSGNILSIGSDSIDGYKLWLGFGDRHCGDGESPTEKMRQFRVRAQQIGEPR